jgi:hypothetical protein
MLKRWGDLWVKNGGVSYPFRLFWIDFVFYNLIKKTAL